MAQLGQYMKRALRTPFVRLAEEDGVYRATYGDRVWYIPWPRRFIALWALEFMSTHVRYQEVLNESDTVIEVGACTGEYTIPAAETVGSTGKVYAFEADERSFKCLTKNVALSRVAGRIVTINHAVSDQGGQELQFRSTPNTIAGGSFHWGTATNTMTTVSLDEFFRTAKPEGEIAVLKMTVNGHEPQVIDGARELLNRTRLVFFQSPKSRELITKLADCGFQLEHDCLVKKGVKAALLRNTSMSAGSVLVDLGTGA